MTINELEEKIPYMLSLAYAQGKAIVLYVDRSCQHIKMSEKTFSMIEMKFVELFAEKPLEIKREFNKKQIDLDKLAEMYRKLVTLEDIAEHFEVSVTLIKDRLNMLIEDGELVKREKDMPPLYKFILENNDKMDSKQMAEAFGATMRQIWGTRHLLKKKGLLVQSESKRAPRKEIFVKSIDNLKIYENQSTLRADFKKACIKNDIDFNSFEEVYSGEKYRATGNKKFYYKLKSDVK